MRKKFENLIRYICKKSEADRAFGRTKLNKLLYFADFGHFRDHGHSISGEEYMAIQNGPVPRAMKPVLDDMIRSGDIREESIDIGARHPQMRPHTVRAPDMSLFSASEKAYVDTVLSKYARMSGTELAELSHAEVGYKSAYAKGKGEKIAYGTAYLPPFSNVTQDIVERTEQLIAQGWREPAAA